NIAQQGASSGQVLKWNGSAWTPQNDSDSGGDDWGAQTAVTGAALSGNGTAGNPLNIAQQGATSGQVLKWNGSAWTPQNDSDSGGDDWGAQTVEASAEFGGNGTSASPLALAQQSAATGQVLKWNGSSWSPADDLIGTGGGGGNTYFAGPGISITGTAPNLTINNTGDLDETNELQTLSLTGNDLTLSDDGGTVTLPIPVVNNYSAGTGIDITGTAPDFTIVNTGDADNDPANELQTLSLTGNDLTLSDGGGTVALPPSNSYDAGAGIDITGTAPNFTIINTGDADNNPANEIQTLSLTGNDLSLSNGGGTVTLPADNTYTAGPGISITGSAPNLTINNTGDADNDPANELQNLSLNGTLLKITGTNSTVSLDTVLNNVSGLWIANGNNISNTNSGNVGVGTTTPAAKFHVKANGQAIRVEGDNAQIGFAKTGGGPTGFIEKASDYLSIATIDSSSILLTTANAKSLFVDGVSGNVGIGDHNTGDAKLAVYHDQNGGFLLQNNVGINWEFVVAPLGSLQLYNSFLGSGFPAGTFAPNGIYTPSDRRLKKDVKDLPGVLNKLTKLNPVSYHYLPEKSNSPLSIGFLAQDVQTYFPELVTENVTRDGNTYLGLNYAGFGVLAVKAVQEQQTQIESLRQENDELRSRLNLLESKINQLVGQAKK
ncbi:MAG: tail fiber domain-containing protein, partial [Thermoanaerobaculia bacterium]|nr:tail fiber domain-containing protein [Thermoanaerobaculia bacterium]